MRCAEGQKGHFFWYEGGSGEHGATGFLSPCPTLRAVGEGGQKFRVGVQHLPPSRGRGGVGAKKNCPLLLLREWVSGWNLNSYPPPPPPPGGGGGHFWVLQQSGVGGSLPSPPSSVGQKNPTWDTEPGTGVVTNSPLHSVFFLQVFFTVLFYNVLQFF